MDHQAHPEIAKREARRATMAPAVVYNPERLGSGEAARLIGRSEATLSRWRRRKLFLPWIEVAGRPMYLKSDLIGFLEGRRVEVEP